MRFIMKNTLYPFSWVKTTQERLKYRNKKNHIGSPCFQWKFWEKIATSDCHTQPIFVHVSLLYNQSIFYDFTELWE